MLDTARKLAVVTGASTGIGLELARQCAQHGFDLIIAANEGEIDKVADELRRERVAVEAVNADLATIEGSIGFMRALMDGQSMRFLPMRAAGWGRPSLIRTLTRSAASSTPT